jgi:hypothetical protein
MLTGASFASTSEVWTSAILEWLNYGIKKYGVDVTFNGITFLLDLIKIYKLVQKLLGGHTRTDRQTDRQTGRLVISQVSLSFLRTVGKWRVPYCWSRLYTQLSLGFKGIKHYRDVQCIRQVPDLNVGRLTGYPDWECSSFSSVCAGKCRDSNFKCATTVFCVLMITLYFV